MSSMEMTKWENCIRWNGVNTPRIPRKTSVQTSLPLKRQRRTTVAAASDTMMHTLILKSDGERNNTAAAKKAVAITVMTRVTMDVFDCSRFRSRSKAADSGVNFCASTRLSISQSRRRRLVCRRVFEVKYFQYTLFATIMLKTGRPRPRRARPLGSATFAPLVSRPGPERYAWSNRLANCVFCTYDDNVR